MKKIFLFLFCIILNNKLINAKNKKTCFVPLSEAYPNRYLYHTPFQYNRFDTTRQWLCKGNCTIRYQQSYNDNEIASFLFDNPFIADNKNNNNYNAGILGIGFDKNTYSKTLIQLKRNSIFIDCTVEVSKINLPYYLHIGIPIQRTEHKISLYETVITDGQVQKGGFIPEYNESILPDLNQWTNTPSSIIPSINNMQSFLTGKGIGNKQDSIYGAISSCPMTLWGLADLYIQIGYDGWKINNTNFGYYIRGIIPTTPTLKSTWNKFVFYPTIGNVDRFEFDIGLNGNITLCDNDTTNQTIYFDGYAGYLCKGDQMRPFDLNNGFFSRYGQVKLFDRENLNYKNMTIWAADLTTQTHEIGGCFKSELVIDFVYQYFQSFFNIGYSFKSQSKENISCCDNNYKAISPYIYGYSPQQYLQTPSPLDNNNWTCQLITPKSSMKEINTSDISIYKNTNEKIVGVPITQENQLLKSDLNYNSGLMNSQILNIFFIGYTYEKLKTQYNTIIGIKAAIAQSPQNYYTPPFYELALILELDY